MFMKKISWAVVFLLAADALASSTTIKQADTIQNSTGGSALAVPSTGSNFVSDTATQTLTNKTLTAPVFGGTVTGTYTLGGTPTIAGSAVSGNISGNAANITGTSNSTLTTLSALSLPGSQVSGAISGNAANITATSNSTLTTLSALSLPGSQVSGNISGNAAGLSSTLGVPSGGTGDVTLTSNGILQGNGTSAISAITCSNSNYVLAWSGSAWSCVAPSSSAPSVTGTFASGTAITAVGGVSFAGGSNPISVNYIVGSGGAVTVTASPQISAGSQAGQILTLFGTSATNTVKLQDGTGLALNGPWVGALSSSLTMTWDSGASVWRETARNN